ncbi:MAG: hypothetical protein KQJ78_11535 [Deltaproteobacteria bacterium]|nr:hypothetical protein [Deltaproteobacteria bacterium]
MKLSHGKALGLAILALGLALALVGCAAKGDTGKKAEMAPAPAKGDMAKKAAPEMFACLDASAVSMQVTPEAQVTDLDCYFDTFNKKKSLHFKVKVKNISQEAQRFRINIFLDGDRAVGGLMPPKGKPPVVKPGEEKTEVYPVQGMDQKPTELTVLVKKASY